MPIGAIGSYLVGLAARERFAAAAAAALGVASVDGGYAVVASVGGAGVQAARAAGRGRVTVTAALVLVLVAARTLLAAVRRYRPRRCRRASRTPSGLSPRRAYADPGRHDRGQPGDGDHLRRGGARAQRRGRRLSGPAVVLFAVGAFVASAAWQLLLVGGGSLLGRLLHRPPRAAGDRDLLGRAHARSRRRSAGPLMGSRSVAEQLFGGGQQHTGGQPVDRGRHVVRRREARGDPDVAVPRVPAVRETPRRRRSWRCPPPWPARPPGWRCRRRRRG